MPTPDTPPDIKKQQKEKELKAKEGAKAAKKAKSQQAAGEEETMVVAAPIDDATNDATADGDAAKKLPKGSKVHYDNQGLMKRPKLIRRRYHKPVSKGFHPIDGIKNFFSRLVHGKPKQKPSGKGKKDQPDGGGDTFPPPGQ